MLPAEMADGTRAQVQRRMEEENAEEGDANLDADPEVVLPNNHMETIPLISQKEKKVKGEMTMV